MIFKEDWQLDDVVEPSDANRWESNMKETYNMALETQKAYAKGEGIELSVVDGILTIAYDDGTEEGDGE